MKNKTIKEIEKYFIDCKKSDRDCTACTTTIKTCCVSIIENEREKIHGKREKKLGNEGNF